MQLKLDFHRESTSERMDFIKDYVDTYGNSLTATNLEMLGNYVLWASEKETGDNFQIESTNSPWKKHHADISYEGLLEQEYDTGAPSEISMGKTAHIKKAKIDRKEILSQLCHDKTILENFYAAIDSLHQNGNYVELSFVFPPWHSLTANWFTLWGQIDKTEFILQNWELAHGKRRPDLPIREDLYVRLAAYLLTSHTNIPYADFISSLIAESETWDGYEYLKKKRHLVTLRTQQYSLLDCLQGPTLQKHPNMGLFWETEEHGFDALYPFYSPALLIDHIDDSCFTPEFHSLCVQQLRYSDQQHNNLRTIDFRDIHTIRQLLIYRSELGETTLGIEERGLTQSVIAYLDYYVAKCDFSDELLYILNAKINKRSNKEIAAELENQYHLCYKENYISTIFTKRILEAIVEQVEEHYKLIEYITMGKSVFKRCSICGEWLPRNTTYFNKRTSTSDGFFSYCKKCKAQKRK